MWMWKDNNNNTSILFYFGFGTISKQKSYIFLFYFYYQSSNWVSNATPLFIQWLSCLSVGRRMNITKFVECPVVESVPLRADVLYTGDI